MGTMQRHLAAHGIIIVGHVDIDGSFRNIPSNVDGVVILTDFIKHGMANRVIETADSRDLLIANTVRKWSTAKTDLERAGFIKASPPVVPLASTAIFKQINTPGNTNMEEIKHSILLSLASDYSLINDRDALLAKTKKDFPDIADPITMSDLDLALLHVRKEWRMSYSARDRAFYTWASTRFTQFRDDGAPWLSTTEWSSATKKIFGVTAERDQLVKARIDVLGEWARDLVRPNVAIQEFVDTNPDVPFDMDAADISEKIRLGHMGGVDTGSGYFTSTLALSEYIHGLIDQSKEPEQPLVAKIVDQPVVVPSPNQTGVDLVGLAELIESGISIRLDDVLLKLSAKIESTKSYSDDLGKDVNAGLVNVIALIQTQAAALGELMKKVASMSDEIRTLREQRDAVRADPAAVKAANLGHAILAASGAEIHLSIGTIKPTPKS